MEKLTNDQINDMSRREINAHFRKIEETESKLWPVCGRFNPADRAIRRINKFEREYGEKFFGLDYYLALEREISNIVNSL